MTKLANHIADGPSKIDLLKELQKKEFVINRLMQDKRITENFLDTTIKELQAANEQLKISQNNELIQKDLLLKTKENQLRQVVDALPMAVSLVDKEYKYRKFNEFYNDWFQIDTSHLIGKEVQNVLGKKFFFDKSKPNLDRAFAGFNSTVESEVVLKNGVKMFLRMHYIPAYNALEEIMGAYVFSDDITILKDKEKEVHQANEKLEDQNNELQKYINSNMQLENFAHIASHDLKAPLKNIVSFSDLLLLNSTPKTEHEQQCLNIIHASAKGMQNLINSLLSYAKVNSEKSTKIAINVSKLLNDILTTLSIDIKSVQATVELESYPRFIRGDYFKIKQLFQNLIQNSLKFYRKGVSPVIKIQGSENDSHWIFVVSDNGIGIEKDFLDKIFLIFNRLHSKDKYDGSGIGLAIVKKIVEQHNGSLEVNSQYGEGTTFRFSIRK